jgi:alpha-ketoglutarate-dependent taurine dioxygenase
MDVQQVGGALGAVVTDIKLSALSDGELTDIRRELAKHQVLIFRDQEMSEDQQLELTGRFGQVFENAALRTPVMTIENSADNPPANDEWHADTSFLENPPAIGILHAIVVPPYGGDTIWVSLRAVYAELSRPLRDLAAGLRAKHIFSAASSESEENHAGHDYKQDVFEFVHPLVIQAPGTDCPSLYLSPKYLDLLVDVSDEESHALLSLFNSFLDRPMFQFRWKWTANDIAIWDERSVNHRGVGDHFFAGPQYRLMHQSLVIAEPPKGVSATA